MVFRWPFVKISGGLYVFALFIILFFKKPLLNIKLIQIAYKTDQNSKFILSFVQAILQKIKSRTCIKFLHGQDFEIYIF